VCVSLCVGRELRDYITQQFPPIAVWIQSIVRQFFKYLRLALINQNWPMHHEI